MQMDELVHHCIRELAFDGDLGKSHRFLQKLLRLEHGWRSSNDPPSQLRGSNLIQADFSRLFPPPTTKWGHNADSLVFFLVIIQDAMYLVSETSSLSSSLIMPPLAPSESTTLTWLSCGS